MNEWLFDYFKNYISDFCGEDIAKKIKISRAENKFEFTSGCAISIYEYFYKKAVSDKNPVINSPDFFINKKLRIKLSAVLVLKKPTKIFS